MKTKIFFIISLLILLNSCNNLKDRTIIDGVIIGQNIDTTYNQMLKLKIKANYFFTNSYVLLQKDKIEDNIIHDFFTESLNLSNFKEDNLDYYGLFVPTFYENSNNIIGMNILLVHTGFISKDIDIKCLFQYVRCDYIDAIEELLTKRYGKPVDTYELENCPLFIFKGKQTQEFIISDYSYKCCFIKWETKNMTITLNKGFKTKFRVYNTIIDVNNPFSSRYIEYFDIKHKLKPNEVSTYSCPAITYKLKEKTIKRLKLDETNIKL